MTVVAREQLFEYVSTLTRKNNKGRDFSVRSVRGIYNEDHLPLRENPAWRRVRILPLLQL
jgi:hypothetical protein